MENNKECLVCKVTDDNMPLLQFTYKTGVYHICSAHMPVLIHKAHELESLLPGSIPSAED